MKKLLIGIALLLSVGTEGFCNGSITDDPTLSSTQIKIAVTGVPEERIEMLLRSP